jgi:hypothetical protein
MNMTTSASLPNIGNNSLDLLAFLNSSHIRSAMKVNPAKVIRSVHPGKIILPLLIGIGVAIFIFTRDGSMEAIRTIHFSPMVVFFLAMAALMIVLRITGYVMRLRILSERKLSIASCIRIILLWEFSTAIAPFAVGGTTVSLLFLYKAGLPIGQGTAIILAALFLDELYFVLVFPFVVLLVGGSSLFMLSSSAEIATNLNKYFYFAMAGYGIMLLVVLLIGYSLFFNQQTLKKLIVAIFSLPGLRRWKEGAIHQADDIVLASRHLSDKPFKFWLKSFGATVFSWTSHHCIVNFLILALIFGIKGTGEPHVISMVEHVNVFARQLIIWIMTKVMPTPGGSGISEIIFMQYMKLFIPEGFTSLMTVIWRLFSYYPYLFIGAVILPGWIRASFMGHSHEEITIEEEHE